MAVKRDLEREARLVDLYVNQEFNGMQISRMLDIPPTTLYDILRRNKVRVRRRGGAQPSVILPYSEKVRLERLYWDQKLSTYEIAHLLGMSDHCIKSRMQRWNIPRRSRPEAIKLARSRQTPRERSEQSKRAMAARNKGDLAQQSSRGGQAKAANYRRVAA